MDAHNVDFVEVEEGLADLLFAGTDEELMLVLDYVKGLKPTEDLEKRKNEVVTKITLRLKELESKVREGSDQFEKYVCTVDNVKTMLENYGVAIIPSILDPQECKDMVDGFWSFLEHVTSQMQVPIDRNNEKSWSTFYDLYLLHGMLMQHWQVGHAQFVWNLRQNRKLVEVFAHIWNITPEELSVSFDGAAFSMPSEVTNRGYYRGNKWFHTDQSLTNSKFVSVQSWVTGLEVRPGDATLTFLEGSNKLHAEFGKEFNKTDRDDWYKLTETETEWFENRGCKAMNIVCPAGSLVLWDSRTMHAGKEPLKTRERRNFRCVVYLCYMPKSLLTEANRKKKVKALKELRMAGHWSAMKVKLFPKTPRTYGKELPKVVDIDPPVLNELGKSLAGLL